MKNIMNLMRGKGDKLLLAIGFTTVLAGCEQDPLNRFPIPLSDKSIKYERLNTSTVYPEEYFAQGDTLLTAFQDSFGNKYFIADSVNQKFDYPWYISKPGTVLRDSEQGRNAEEDFQKIKSDYAAQQGAQ